MAPEAEDTLLLQEMALMGEDQVLYASDMLQGEGRDNAALEILQRSDLTEQQKRKFLYDNTVRLFGDA